MVASGFFFLNVVVKFLCSATTTTNHVHLHDFRCEFELIRVRIYSCFNRFREKCHPNSGFRRKGVRHQRKILLSEKSVELVGG